MVNASTLFTAFEDRSFLEDYFLVHFKGNASMFTNAWKKMETILFEVFASREEAILGELNDAWGESGNVAEEEARFLRKRLPAEALIFQLFRADFIFKSNGEPLLIEVNSMPQFIKDHRLPVLHEMYQMVGLDKRICSGKEFVDEIMSHCPPQDCAQFGECWSCDSKIKTYDNPFIGMEKASCLNYNWTFLKKSFPEVSAMILYSIFSCLRCNQAST
jgi:hypothetical protein